MVKQIMSVTLLSIMLLMITSCYNSRAIVNIEIGRFPDNIVYFAGEADSVDLSGTTLISTARGGSTRERSIEDFASIGNPDSFKITGYVNFLVPGVYEIQLYLEGYGLIGRIPIQVIEREHIECATCVYETSVVEE